MGKKVPLVTREEIREIIGLSYGDPDAKLIDDRKLQIVVEEQSKVGRRLNALTFSLVVVGLLNVVVLVLQVWKPH
jgi:hypothetical protein